MRAKLCILVFVSLHLARGNTCQNAFDAFGSTWPARQWAQYVSTGAYTATPSPAGLIVNLQPNASAYYVFQRLDNPIYNLDLEDNWALSVCVQIDQQSGSDLQFWFGAKPAGSGTAQVYINLRGQDFVGGWNLPTIGSQQFAGIAPYGTCHKLTMKREGLTVTYLLNDVEVFHFGSYTQSGILQPYIGFQNIGTVAGSIRLQRFDVNFLDPPPTITSFRLVPNYVNLGQTELYVGQPFTLDITGANIEGNAIGTFYNGSCGTAGCSVLGTPFITSASYVAPNQLRNTAYGNYTFILKNGLGGVISNPVSFKVVTPPPLVPSCAFSPLSVTTGQGSSVAASFSGGVGPFTFQWSGIVTGTAQSVAVPTQNTAGTFTTNVSVRDSLGIQSTASCSLTVIQSGNPPLFTDSFTNLSNWQTLAAFGGATSTPGGTGLVVSLPASGSGAYYASIPTFGDKVRVSYDLTPASGWSSTCLTWVGTRSPGQNQGQYFQNWQGSDLYLRSSSPDWTAALTGAALPGTRRILSMERDGQTVRYYLDGTLKGTLTTYGQSGTVPLWVGFERRGSGVCGVTLHSARVDSLTSPTLPQPLTVSSCAVTPNPINTGQSSQATAVVSGGSAPYTYAWTGANIGPTTGTIPTQSVAGTFPIGLTVRDSTGASATPSPGCPSLVVQAPAPLPLTASCFLSPASINTGQSSQATAVVSGGTAPYTYTWTGLVTGTAQTVTTPTQNAAGSFTANLTVRDAANVTATASCPLTVTAPSSSLYTANLATFPTGWTQVWTGGTGTAVTPGTSLTLAGPPGSGRYWTSSQTFGNKVRLTLRYTDSSQSTADSRLWFGLASPGSSSGSAYWNVEKNSAYSLWLGYSAVPSGQPLTGSTPLATQHTLVIERDGLNVRYYIDGSLKYTKTDFGDASQLSLYLGFENRNAGGTMSLAVSEIKVEDLAPIAPPPLSGSCSFNPSSIVRGGTSVATATALGGTGPYTYTWSGVASGTAASVTTPAQNTAGTFTENLTIRDSTNASVAISCPLIVTAPPPLATSCSVSPNPINTGQGSSAVATPSGGVPPYTYTWGGAATGTGQTGTIAVQNTAGTFPVTLTVRDSTNASVTPSPACLSLTVTAPSSSLYTANLATFPTGWTQVWTGGTGTAVTPGTSLTLAGPPGSGRYWTSSQTFGNKVRLTLRYTDSSQSTADSRLWFGLASPGSSSGSAYWNVEKNSAYSLWLGYSAVPSGQPLTGSTPLATQHTLVIERDGLNVRYYIDGSLKYTKTDFGDASQLSLYLGFENRNAGGSMTLAINSLVVDAIP